LENPHNFVFYENIAAVLSIHSELRKTYFNRRGFDTLELFKHLSDLRIQDF